jgi:hypothetical protein
MDGEVSLVLKRKRKKTRSKGLGLGTRAVASGGVGWVIPHKIFWRPIAENFGALKKYFTD